MCKQHKFNYLQGRHHSFLYEVIQYLLTYILYFIYQLRNLSKVYENKINADNLTSSLKSYLFGVGIRIAYNVNRKNGKIPTEDIPETIDVPHDDEHGLGEENEKIIQKAVHEMGEPCHTILVKQYWEEKKVEEIAIEMNYKNPDTAKTQKYKCIQKLKNELRGKMVYQS